MPKANKSLESALDEERREVMALLEGRRSAPRTGSREPNARLRTASPAGVAQSPVRSMLDIGNAPPHARHASVAGTTPSGVTVPQSAQYPSPSVRSMLDTSSPPPTPHSAPIHHVRSASTASTSSPVSVASPVSAPASGLPSPKTALEDAYQFDMPPAPPGKGGKKKGALASVFGSSSHDHQRPRHNSTSGLVGSRRPMSPSSRLGSSGRSMSPAQRGLNTNSLNLMPDPRKYVSDSGKVIDMSNAYRRLSDANLMRSGGNLANLPSRKGSDPEKGESRAPDGGVRLEKDYFADDDNDDDDDDDEEALDDSDDDADDDEDEDGWGSKKRRGRQRRRSKLGDAESSESPAAASDRRPSSLMEAAEDERKTVGQKYRSLLEPEVTITSPSGEKMSANKKSDVHPITNFDDAASHASTPIDSDTEADMSDIRRAQKMAISISPVHSTPESHRCLRQVIRGDYDDLQREAEVGLRRQRMYLVATDLSDEAAYALEWTIGTVLRDGDTLLAVYAVDEDVGTGGEACGVGIGEAANMMSDTAKTLQTITDEQKETKSDFNNTLQPSPLGQQAAKNAAEQRQQQPDWESMDKPERERWHATMEVSDRCVKLLRKTRLQVRVVVEVFHCKSPKHMITEVIDHLEPTLVVLGSRGRSALKGVLLGSFSNYLVTKSSVPVMVARKRLRKHSKYKRDNLRLSNMLASPRGRLELAKID